jgi:subtilisin family serine protease
MKLYSLARWSLFVITLFWVAVIASTHSFSAREQSPGLSKIAPWVLERTANGQEAEFLVVLQDQADLSGAEALKTKQEKGRFVRDALWNKAQETQGPLLDWLAERKVEHRSYYIVNLIWVKGTADVALELASRADVARLEGNPQIRNVAEPAFENETESAPQADAPAAIEWGITNTGAPDVWAQGFTGQGLVVAGADTGYRWDHAAIKSKYRGWDGVTANHDYNWHDSIHSGGGTCGPNALAPCDDNNHGTHTMGTMTGDDGGANQIGMAPGAKWIGCRNMNQGVGTPATYIECFEFFLAPYPVSGTPAQGDPTKAPDVTNNSWGCPPSEGCSAGSLLAAVQAQRAAGIMTVVSAGNAGPSCGTVNDPPAIYDESYSIGSHTISNAISGFSSRGPVTIDGSMRLKPDITAPGSSVRSATRTSTTSYATFSGTSMAGPHVAGAVALLWSAKPSLRNNISATEALFNDTAVHVMDSTCGTPTSVPNHVWGWGRLDVRAAVNKLALMSAVSRKVHGSAGTFDIPLPLTGAPGVECRSSGSYTLVFTFNKTVVSGNATVTEGSAATGPVSMDGNTMSVTLSGVTDAQRITLQLSSVTATDSQVLEPTSVSMNMLVGDVNGSKSVNSSDLGIVKAQSGAPLGQSNFRADVAISGAINASDIGLVKSRSGNSVP